MNMNMGGEPTPEEKPVVENGAEETAHVNPYMEREEQEKVNEYNLELEKWQADLDAKVAKMRVDGEDEQTIELFIEYSPKPTLKIESVMEKEKREAETALADFEKNHSLEYLNSIEILTPELFKLFKLDQKTEADQIEAMLASVSIEDAIKYKERTSAKNDLIPLVELLKKVYGKEFYEEESYRKLSRAVGVLIIGKIRHY